MERRRLIAFLLLAGAAFTAAPARGEDVSVKLTERSRYQVEGAFEAPVPLSAAWDVLTDYEGIGRFVPAVKGSRVAGRKRDAVSLEQDVAGGWLFFSRQITLRLEVRESRPGIISFEEVSGKDFVSYAGSWTLEERPGGTRVVYRLRAEPKFRVPGFVARGAYRRAARDLLRGIRAEMVRRNGGGHER